MDKVESKAGEAFRPPHEVVLEQHDPAVLKAVRELNDVVYVKERVLTSRQKEMLTVVILTILKAPHDTIKDHIKRALGAGATEQEILESLELIVTPAGLPTFEHGLMAWADVTGAKPLEL